MGRCRVAELAIPVPMCACVAQTIASVRPAGEVKDTSCRTECGEDSQSRLVQQVSVKNVVHSPA